MTIQRGNLELQTDEEIIKHKNVLVKKYNFFIKNYEEQLSYFKNEYNSRHKKNICITIITSVFLITSVLLLIFAFKGILKPLNSFIVLGIGFGGHGFPADLKSRLTRFPTLISSYLKHARAKKIKRFYSMKQVKEFTKNAVCDSRYWWNKN